MSSLEVWRVRALLRHARRLYSTPDVPEHTNKHNRKALVRSILFLGNRWVLSSTRGRGAQ